MNPTTLEQADRVFPSKVTLFDTVVLLSSLFFAIVGPLICVIFAIKGYWGWATFALLVAILMACVCWRKFFGPPDPMPLDDTLD